MQYVFERLDAVQDGLADHLQRAGGPPGSSSKEDNSGAATPHEPGLGRSEGEGAVFSTAMSFGGGEPEALYVAVPMPSKDQGKQGVEVSAGTGTTEDPVRVPSMATGETGRVAVEQSSGLTSNTSTRKH